MKSRTKLVLGGSLVVLILAIAAHAAVMNILTVGTTRYSEVINGPRYADFPATPYGSPGGERLALSPWNADQCCETRDGRGGRRMWRG